MSVVPVVFLPDFVFVHVIVLGSFHLSGALALIYSSRRNVCSASSCYSVWLDCRRRTGKHSHHGLLNVDSRDRFGPCIDLHDCSHFSLHLPHDAVAEENSHSSHERQYEAVNEPSSRHQGLHVLTVTILFPRQLRRKQKSSLFLFLICGVWFLWLYVLCQIPLEIQSECRL